MTRSGSTESRREEIAELFASSPDAAVRWVLQASGKALAKSEILDELAAAGVPRSVANGAWGRVQKRLRVDGRVIAEQDRRPLCYRWNPAAQPLPEAPEQDAELVSINRLRQVELDAARELAGLAIDVEEQIAKGASARAIVHRVRARMKRLRLEPTESAGETVAFDRARHQPIRSGIAEGAPVLVIRPGYIWRVPGNDLLIERPVVQD